MTDPVVHIPRRPEDGHSEPSVRTDSWITQSTMDGLQQLLNWLDGFKRGSNAGDIPGHFQLVMHYRSLSGDVRQAIKNRDIPTENAE